jgi:hypothetical protein
MRSESYKKIYADKNDIVRFFENTGLSSFSVSLSQDNVKKPKGTIPAAKRHLAEEMNC